MASAAEQIFGNKKLKRKLIKSVKSVKEKVKALKENQSILSTALEETFQPITKPLNVLVDEQVKSKNRNDNLFNTKFDKSIKNENLEMRNSDSESMTSAIDNFSDVSSDPEEVDITLKGVNTESNQERKQQHVGEQQMLNVPARGVDHGVISDIKKVPFGVYQSDGKFYIGKYLLEYIDDQTIKVHYSKYTLTPGLAELLYKSKPNDSLINKQDIENYQDICNEANVFRRAFQQSGQVQGDKSIKYNTYIKPYLSKHKIIKGGNLDGGVGMIQKQFYPNTDYVYWDNANELVDRLRLLVMSQNAGNTAHTNEINSIIEELVEAGVIIK